MKVRGSKTLYDQEEYKRFKKEFDMKTFVRLVTRFHQYKGKSSQDEKFYALKYIQVNKD